MVICLASYLHDIQDTQAEGSPRRASQVCIIVQHAHLIACNSTARPLQVFSAAESLVCCSTRATKSSV